MNARIKEIYDRAEGRYYDEGETLELVGYAEAMNARLDTLAAVERAESAILDAVERAVLERFPEMKNDYGPAAGALVRRDQMMVLRYAATAALMQDQAFIYDKLAVWLRTLMMAMCKPEQVGFGYRKLLEACGEHLTPIDADAVAPFISVVIREFDANGGKPS
jgi:hypothetical protein